MFPKKRMTKKQALKLHEKIWSDPEFKKRYDELEERQQKEFTELYNEFREKYTVKE